MQALKKAQIDGTLKAICYLQYVYLFKYQDNHNSFFKLVK